MLRRWCPVALAILSLLGAALLRGHAQDPLPKDASAAMSPPAGVVQPCPTGILQGPTLSSGQPPSLPPAQIGEDDHPLPINLATALHWQMLVRW